MKYVAAYYYYARVIKEIGEACFINYHILIFSRQFVMRSLVYVLFVTIALQMGQVALNSCLMDAQGDFYPVT